MNFAFTEEQEELRKTVRAFLDSKSAEAAVREQMETETGFDPAVWSQMGEQLGLQGLVVPEEFGGSGYSYVELGIVLEEMGRSLLCAPFFSTVAMAIPAIAAKAAKRLPRMPQRRRLSGLNLPDVDGNAIHSVVHPLTTRLADAAYLCRTTIASSRSRGVARSTTRRFSRQAPPVPRRRDAAALHAPVGRGWAR